MLTGLLLLGEVTVNATVEMKAKVDNRNFTEDLKNKSSKAFKDFEKDFRKQVRAQRRRGHPRAGAAPFGGLFGAGQGWCPDLPMVSPSLPDE